MMTHSTQIKQRGFSLIEVLLAIGVFAFTILAVIAMLGSSSQATAEVLNSVNAGQISDAIRTELENYGYDALVSDTSGTGPLRLYGSKDADRVVLINNAGNDPEDDPPGMYPRDRFFLIEIERLGVPNEDSFAHKLADDWPFAAQLALSVRVYWPYNIPLGPPTANPMGDDVRTVDSNRRSVAIFNVSIPRT